MKRLFQVRSDNARGSRQQWLLQYLSSRQVFTSLTKQFYVKGNKEEETMDHMIILI